MRAAPRSWQPVLVDARAHGGVFAPGVGQVLDGDGQAAGRARSSPLPGYDGGLSRGGPGTGWPYNLEVAIGFGQHLASAAKVASLRPTPKRPGTWNQVGK